MLPLQAGHAHQRALSSCSPLLPQDVPDQHNEACYHSGLAMAVDSLARSVDACDAAFNKLEGWAKEVSRSLT